MDDGRGSAISASDGPVASGWRPAAATCQAAKTRYALADIDPTPPGLARLRHGVLGRSRAQFVRRVLEVGAELALASVLERLRPLRDGLRRILPGRAVAGTSSIAIYQHWSPTGQVSPMVLCQLAGWRASGFDIVFVSNAAPPPADCERVAEHAALLVLRDNVGRDFGGWRDGLAVALERFGEPAELLLANDSVLGPIRGMAPIVAALRTGGEGLFGFTESRGGGPHLQSYALLARGPAAVREVAQHLSECRPSHSKWKIVQQGEIGLTRRMLDRGHRVAALFSWPIISADLPPALLASLGPRFLRPEALTRYPLNATHHLWRVLVERYGFPYLKTELVLRNPGRLPGVEHWHDLVDPVMRLRIEEHLEIMRRDRWG